MKKILLFISFLILSSVSYSQNFTISGYVDDMSSGEKLISAFVYDLKSGKGTVTNTYGFYSLTLPRDSVILNVSYIGYKGEVRRLKLAKNQEQNFSLSSSIQLSEVEITGARVQRIEERTQMSRVDVPIEQIKSMPALFGEVDVLKTLQLLPGIQT